MWRPLRAALHDVDAALLAGAMPSAGAVHLSARVHAQVPGVADAGFVAPAAAVTGGAVPHRVPVLLSYLFEGLPLPLPLLEMRWLVELHAHGMLQSALTNAQWNDVQLVYHAFSAEHQHKQAVW